MRTDRTWTVLQLDSGEVHVRPTVDAVAHELSDDCVCGPRTEVVLRADGRTGWMVVHHSLDGREEHER